MLDPRPLRTSPFYERQRDLGAVFLEAAGWERPHWYETNTALVAGRDIPTPDDWAARWWSPIVGAEAQITRERVALYDMTSLTRIEVSGRGAAAFLQRVTTGNVDRVGRHGHLLPPARRGGRHPQRRHGRPARARASSRSAPTVHSTSTCCCARRPRASSVRDVTAGHLLHRRLGSAGPRGRVAARPRPRRRALFPRHANARRYRAGHRAAAVLRRRAGLGALHHRRHGPHPVGHPLGGRPGARDHRRRPRCLQLAAAGEGLPLVRHGHDVRARSRGRPGWASR